MMTKIIEYLSAKNDETFKIYLEKVHKLLRNETIQKSLSIQYIYIVSITEKKKMRKKDIYRVSESTFSTISSVKSNEV